MNEKDKETYGFYYGKRLCGDCRNSMREGNTLNFVERKVFRNYRKRIKA